MHAYLIEAIPNIPESIYSPTNIRLNGVEWLPSFDNTPVNCRTKLVTKTAIAKMVKIQTLVCL